MSNFYQVASLLIGGKVAKSPPFINQKSKNTCAGGIYLIYLDVWFIFATSMVYFFWVDIQIRDDVFPFVQV